MHKMSHRLFALGLSSAFAFFLNINLIALPLMLFIAFFVGSLPDLDMKLGMKHRGFTHNIFFFIVMTFISTLGVFYLYYYLQEYAIKYDVFDVEMTIYSGVPIPSFFEKVVTFSMVDAVSDTFFAYLAFFFASYMSHFLLDIITPTGLDVGGVNLHGSINSGNGFFNSFFSLIGLATFIASMFFIVLRTFTTLDINWSSWYFMIVGALVFVVIAGSLISRRIHGEENLKCYKLDNNIDVCLKPGECLQIGSDKDDKICNIDDVDL